MNRYQSKMSREIKQLRKDLLPGMSFSYRRARRFAKWKIRFRLFTPCEDCDNMYCRRDNQNKLFYCKDNK